MVYEVCGWGRERVLRGMGSRARDCGGGGFNVKALGEEMANFVIPGRKNEAIAVVDDAGLQYERDVWLPLVLYSYRYEA